MAGFEHYAWLMKSEPSEVSVDDVLQMDGCKVGWFGVRNYQARNFMRDLCKIGDPVLFYHSSCAQPGIVGIGEIASEPYPDPTQFEETSGYFDAKSTQENRAGFRSMFAYCIRSDWFPSQSFERFPAVRECASFKRAIASRSRP